jgi:hypothetical protein
MKRRAAVVAALVASIGLHVFLIGAGRFAKDTPLVPNADVPSVMWSTTIFFPGAGDVRTLRPTHAPAAK